MLTLYRLALYAALPFVLLRLFARGLRDRRYLEGIPQRFGYGMGATGSIETRMHGCIWLHAVSVGEVHAAAPLVKRLLQSHADKPLLITTMTPTGADRARILFADAIADGRVQNGYLPYDYPGAMRRFLDAAQPSLALIMETEIWPNMLAECRRRGLPVIYVNVRLSARSANGYRRFPGIIRPALQSVAHFAVQSDADAERLIQLGAAAEAVTVTGNLKFDVTPPADLAVAAQDLRRAIAGDRPVFIAGSTHDGEEAQVLAAFAALRAEFPELLLLLVPRHPPRCDAVLRLCKRAGYNTALRSQTMDRQTPTDCDIYLGDTMGELSLFIAASDVAFIGGSLTPVGGHNLLEACAAGVPSVFGSFMFNFAEIAELVLRNSAGLQVQDADALAEVARRLLREDALRARYGANGLALVEKNRGALEEVCKVLNAVLSRRG